MKHSRPLKILILDNNREEDSYGSHHLVEWALKMAPAGTEIVVRRPPDHDLPHHDWKLDAMIISGSVTSCLETAEEWIAPYHDYVTGHIKRSTPILGVCFGHQTLARCLFNLHGREPSLRKSKDAELGWTHIQTEKNSPLFEGLPDVFVTYSSHYEEVHEVPPGAVVLAKTPRCEIQAFALEGKPIFGVQFHPEYGKEEGDGFLEEKIKKGIRKDWILNPGKGHQLYDENVGKVIFGNFIRIAANHK